MRSDDLIEAGTFPEDEVVLHDGHLEVDLQEAVETRPTPRTKRALDVILAVLGLILSAPLWLLIAVAIKLNDRGTVFYRQKRWGRGGEPFTLLKFRTMLSDSDVRFGIKGATEKDARVTKVGQLLRATGMDELPQFLAILIGHMSFVGPRALAVGELVIDRSGQEFDYSQVPGFRKRLAIQPGLTGPATIYLPKDANPMRKLEYDLRYIEEWSFRGDVGLILRSFWISIRGRWESREDKVAERPKSRSRRVPVLHGTIGSPRAWVHRTKKARSGRGRR